MTEQTNSTQKEAPPGEGATNFLRVVALLAFVGSLLAAVYAIFTEGEFVVGLVMAASGTAVLAILYVMAAISDNMRLIAKNSIKDKV